MGFNEMNAFLFYKYYALSGIGKIIVQGAPAERNIYSKFIDFNIRAPEERHAFYGEIFHPDVVLQNDVFFSINIMSFQNLEPTCFILNKKFSFNF